MKLLVIGLLAGLEATTAFAPSCRTSQSSSSSVVTLQGYLDDLNRGVAPEEEEVDESKEATNMKKENVDRFGAGSWDGFVDFDEFDGGDGQMGVAGDGNAKLEKFDMSQMTKSKTMSAKNAWGRSTGYADELRSKGVDTARAQQLENWKNQQEIQGERRSQQKIVDQYDQKREDEDWRTLAKFGVERNQDFDMDATFGGVAPGEVEGVIELTARMYGPAAVSEFALRNPYMGFADFRAAFTPETGDEWTVSPSEGALKQREDTIFVVRFKAQKPGIVEGYLVIETEDFKKTWKVVGSTA